MHVFDGRHVPAFPSWRVKVKEKKTKKKQGETVQERGETRSRRSKSRGDEGICDGGDETLRLTLQSVQDQASPPRVGVGGAECGGERGGVFGKGETPPNSISFAHF